MKEISTPFFNVTEQLAPIALRVSYLTLQLQKTAVL